MSTSFPTLRVLVLLASAPLCCPLLLAQQIVPVSQDRSLRATVINPRCQPSSRSQEIPAGDFGPFNEHLEILMDCGGTIGGLGVSQQSEINELALLAAGTSRSQGVSASPITIHTIGGSLYEVAFSIAEPTTYTLSGEIRAVMVGSQAQGASASATLLGPGDVMLASFIIGAPADGTELRQPVFASAALAPGTYRLRAHAWSVLDRTVPPTALAESEFTLRLEIEPRCPTDLNGDRVVDLHDLALLLAEFGCNGTSCLSDIDGSGGTELSDLTLLLSDFGQSCP